VEAPRDDAFAKNVSVHGFENFGPRRIRAQIEFSIEGEQLEGVVMIGPAAPALGPM
jgi:hypothetical protein